jgi:hypothetical protein
MKLLYFSLIALLFTLSSCLKEHNDGINDKSDSYISKVEVTDTASLFIDCLDEWKILNDSFLKSFYPVKFIIKDSIEYLYILDSIKELNFGCSAYNYPEIDFNKYSLLGYFNIVSARDIFKRHVYKNIINKKIIYEIEIININNNRYGSTHVFNWMLIPKIPPDYDVEIDTIHIY